MDTQYGTVDNELWTSLHYASLNGHINVIKFLLKEGLSINVVDDSVFWNYIHLHLYFMQSKMAI